MKETSDKLKQRQADEALRASEERYRLLFDNMLDGYAHCKMLFDDQGHPSDFVYLDVNSAFERLTGLMDVTGKKVTEVIPGVRESNPEMFEIYGRVALTGKPERFEMELKSLGIWLSISVYSTAREYFVAVFDNITERKRAEEAQRESEEQFHTLANAIPTLCWMANADGWIFWYNHRWYEYTGTTPEQMEGWGWQSVHNPETLPKVLERWQGSIGSGKPFDMVFPLRGADGVFRPFLTRVMPVRGQDGKVARWFGTNTDITEQKRSEDVLDKLVHERTAELAAKNAQLLEFGNRYRTLYESIDEGFCIVEMIFDENEKPIDYRFLEINPSFEKQTGLKDAQGKRMRELAPKHEEHWFEIYGKIALTGEPARFQNRAEQLGFWYDVYAFRFGQPEDRQVGILFNDISQRKRAEEEAVRLQKLEGLRVLAGGIAHDINNMMVSVTANAGLAQMTLEPGSPALEYIEAIETASMKIGGFTKQILSFTGKIVAEKEAISLNKVITEISKVLVASISRKAQVELCLSEGLPEIKADPQNIQQVLMSLVMNASEALGESKGAIKISTGTIDAGREYLESLDPAYLPEGEYIYLEVSDTGCGMSRENRKRVFEPFYTTKFTGRGLGLSAVYGIVSEYGGAIGIKSEEGCGATFKVVLPVNPVPSPSPRQLLSLSRP